VRAASSILAFLVSLVTISAQSPVNRLDRATILGKEYVRVDDWARANNFQLRWLTKGKELQASNASAKLVFEVNSRKISLNGVNVWLSVPIAAKEGSCFVAPVDLNTAIHPVLYPKTDRIGAPIKTICLDPGHGGKDPGNQEGPRQEKKYTLLLAEEVRALLMKAGFTVKLTRTRDTFVDLPVRSDIARRTGADLFISLHFNSGRATSYDVSGVEVYCMTPSRTSSTNARGEGADTGAYAGNRQDAKNMLLAYQLQKRIARNLGMEDRGVRRARFAVLRPAVMPAVLIEGGFMSHPTEARKIYDAAHRRQMAQAIVDGIIAYRNLVER
jgi:N-acetylmuramoyl-L-alanine amidase